MILVSYDISSNRLRGKIAKKLEDYGVRIQYSVFECDLSPKRYERLYGELAEMTIGIKDGSIRFYEICASCQKKMRLIGSRQPLNSVVSDRGDGIIVY
jgi:CRISPR-associated protein Cas2